MNEKINENIELEIGSWGASFGGPINYSTFTTTIDGNEITIKSKSSLRIDNDEDVEVVRKIKLTEEEMAKIIVIMNHLDANKEAYRSYPDGMICDAGYDVKGQYNGVSFDYKNNTELYHQLSEIIDDIVEAKHPDIYKEIKEEKDQLIKIKIDKDYQNAQMFRSTVKNRYPDIYKEIIDEHEKFIKNIWSKNEEPSMKPLIEESLKEKYPTFFDENDQLKENAEELNEEETNVKGR